MNGTLENEGSGISIGRLALEVADVGRGGKDSDSDVRPGMRSATTFCIDLGFYERKS